MEEMDGNPSLYLVGKLKLPSQTAVGRTKDLAIKTAQMAAGKLSNPRVRMAYAKKKRGLNFASLKKNEEK